MMNQTILEELQKVIEQPDGNTLPQKNVNQLLLASLVSLMQTITEIDKKIDAICRVDEELECLRKDVESNYIKRADALALYENGKEMLRSNLAYKVGDFVIQKPKTFAFLLVVVIATVLLLLGYTDAQAIRLLIAKAIGVPEELLVTPIP